MVSFNTFRYNYIWEDDRWHRLLVKRSRTEVDRRIDIHILNEDFTYHDFVPKWIDGLEVLLRRHHLDQNSSLILLSDLNCTVIKTYKSLKESTVDTDVKSIIIGTQRLSWYKLKVTIIDGNVVLPAE